MPYFNNANLNKIAELINKITTEFNVNRVYCAKIKHPMDNNKTLPIVTISHIKPTNGIVFVWSDDDEGNCKMTHLDDEYTGTIEYTESVINALEKAYTDYSRVCNAVVKVMSTPLFIKNENAVNIMKDIVSKI